MKNKISRILTYPFRMIWKGLYNTYQAILSAWRFTLTIPGRVIRSPVQSYHAIVRGRNWLLAKIEYLQSESAKWKMLFNVVKSPFSLLRAMGFSPQMAATMLFGATAVGGGLVATEVFEGRSFARGDAGVYTAPLDIPTEYVEGDNTLRIDLGTTPVGEISIANVTIGTAFTGSTLPSGESNVIIIGGIAASSGFTETYLEVGHLIIDRWRCTKLQLSNIEVFELNVKYNASDGQSISATPGTPRNRGIGGGNRADNMSTQGGYYDQLKITSASSGVNGKVDVLRLSNLYTKGGPCIVSRVKAGTIDVLLGEFGAGDGFATKDLSIATSVVYKTFNNVDNVETSISPP